MTSNQSSPRTAIYPGSFDPVTRGHLDVIQRAEPVFDRLVVAVVANPGKSPVFSLEERLELLRQEVAELRTERRVEVLSFEGLTVHLAERLGAPWIVRGLRSSEDAGYELPMIQSNRRCGVEPIDTLLFAASAEHAFISSRLVRQIAAEGGRLSDFVPSAVEAALRERFGAARDEA